MAASTPPISALPNDSRQAAEVLLLVQYVDLLNGGCDNRGDAVVTALPTIEWTPPSYDPTADGTIADIAFTADLGADGIWNVVIIAC